METNTIFHKSIQKEPPYRHLLTFGGSFSHLLSVSQSDKWARSYILDFIPDDLICIQMKIETASVSSVYRCILRLVSIVYDTVFSILHIRMHFHVEVCAEPFVKVVLIVCRPEDRTIQKTAVLEAVWKSTDVDTTSVAEIIDCHLHFFVDLS